MKSGNLNFVEPSGPLQACNGTDLPLPICFGFVKWCGRPRFAYRWFSRKSRRGRQHLVNLGVDGRTNFLMFTALQSYVNYTPAILLYNKCGGIEASSGNSFNRTRNPLNTKHVYYKPIYEYKLNFNTKLFYVAPRVPELVLIKNWQHEFFLT